MAEGPVLTLDTATKFEAHHRGAVVVCGSHGGAYPGYLAATASLRAIILNDAGVGLSQAGIAGLDFCQNVGMAAAAVSHVSARIGDAADMLARGRISHANPIAAGLGVEPGQPTAAAADLLAGAPPWTGDVPVYPEARHVVRRDPDRPRVICIDSASLTQPDDAGQIVITGSHGAMLPSMPGYVFAVDALVAVFNDAGIGIDDIGVTRLPALDQRGIAAATVDTMTARIGDGLSSYQDGRISRVNRTAQARGARSGMTTRDLVELF